MKKAFCFLIIILFLFPLIAEARREPDYIGKSKAQGKPWLGWRVGSKIVRGDAKIWMINFVANGPSPIGGWLTLYDAYQAPLEADIICEIEIASAANSETIVLKYPIDVSKGLYAVGENGTYIILYE